MPRKARIDAPDALHHIIIRGIEGKQIFNDDRDYQNFIQRLGNIFEDTSTPCYAWALLPNHVHLLCRTGLAPVSTLMRRLLTGYAQQFNRRHRRHGHLFQNRYKSILCEEEPYLMELIRYIHLNPIRAAIVEDLKALKFYPNCGHSALMGKANNPWQDTQYILKLFGKTVREARISYSVFVSKGIALGRRNDLTGGGLIRSYGGWTAVKASREAHLRIISDERILGSSDFVESVLAKANEVFEKKTLALASGVDLEKIIHTVAKCLDVNSSLLKSSSRQRVIARVRSIICALAMDRLMISGAEVARKLNLSPSAVSKLVYKGRQDRLIKALEKELFDF
jgi:REP element-mobilizing transposase RayT